MQNFDAQSCGPLGTVLYYTLQRCRHVVTHCAIFITQTSVHFCPALVLSCLCPDIYSTSMHRTANKWPINLQINKFYIGWLASTTFWYRTFRSINHAWSSRLLTWIIAPLFLVGRECTFASICPRIFKRYSTCTNLAWLGIGVRIFVEFLTFI